VWGTAVLLRQTLGSTPATTAHNTTTIRQQELRAGVRSITATSQQQPRKQQQQGQQYATAERTRLHTHARNKSRKRRRAAASKQHRNSSTQQQQQQPNDRHATLQQCSDDDTTITARDTAAAGRQRGGPASQAQQHGQLPFVKSPRPARASLCVAALAVRCLLAVSLPSSLPPTKNTKKHTQTSKSEKWG
jgi:hypothetical protein